MSDPAIGTFSKVLGDFEQSWGTAKSSKTGFLFGVSSCSLTPSQSLISNPTLRGDFNSSDPAQGPIAASGSLVKVADAVSFPWFTYLLCGNKSSAGAVNYTHESKITADIPLSAVVETSFNIGGVTKYSAASGVRINRMSIPIEPTGFLTTSYDLMAQTVAISDTAYNAGGSPVKATGTLTSNGTAPADGDTVKIGATTYTFKTNLTAGGTTPNEVHIGTAAVSLDNLKYAVNYSGGSAGTDYGSGGSANASALATTNANTYQVFEALVAGAAGNSILFQDASLNLDTSALTLTGGSDAGATDWTASAPLDHLELAAANVQIGGSPVGYISKGSLAIDANLNGNDYRVGSAGGRGSLVPGKYKVSGSLDLCLDSAAVLTLITGTVPPTPVSLSFKWAADTNTYFLVEIPRCWLQKTGPTLNGEGAVMVTAQFEASYDSGTGSMIKFTTGNQTAGGVYA